MAGLYAGLDVSLELTSVCVVDEEGRMVREAKLASEPDAITRELRSVPGDYVRVGLEAGPLSQWLCFGLKDAGLPVVCIDPGMANAYRTAQQSEEGQDRRGEETGRDHAPYVARRNTLPLGRC